jgi:hypothetical protein
MGVHPTMCIFKTFAMLGGYVLLFCLDPQALRRYHTNVHKAKELH